MLPNDKRVHFGLWEKKSCIGDYDQSVQFQFLNKKREKPKSVKLDNKQKKKKKLSSEKNKKKGRANRSKPE